MKLTIIAKGTHSIDWPEIEVSVNNQIVGKDIVTEYSELDFEFELSCTENQISIRYTNKKEHHTIQQNNVIVSDQSLTLVGIRFNDILLSNWMITDGDYYPEYFEGFKNQVPDAPTKLHSQLIWHFPGRFELPTLPYKDNFWRWYQHQNRMIHVRAHDTKTGLFKENFLGSFESYQDLINEIKKIINV